MNEQDNAIPVEPATINENTNGQEENQENSTNSKVEENSKSLEGNIAADYIEGLLDVANLPGDIEIKVTPERATVSIIGEDPDTVRALRPLIGKDGASILALQELTRIVVRKKIGEYSNIVLDVVGWRKDQMRKVEALVRKAIDKTKTTNADYNMPPMNSYERMFVHNAVHNAGLNSYSVGKGSGRHVIITTQEVTQDSED